MRGVAGRIVALVDGNCFFASCLQAADPALGGRPVVVAGDPEQRQGVVLAVSYEVRRLARGPVRAGMPVGQARRLLPPGVIFAAPDHQLFCAVSDRLYAILQRFSPLNERASVDEIYADWTGCTHLFGGDPVTMARRVKAAIAAAIGIPVSVGIGHSKIVAKTAAELEKPDGLTWLQPPDWRERVYPLPVGDLYGVGPKTLPKLQRFGIRTVGDLARADAGLLHRVFGVYGEQMRRAARGEDDDPVHPNDPEETKSFSHATTLPRDLRDRAEQRQVLLDLSDQVARRLRQAGFAGRTIALSIRDPSFRTITRSRSLPAATHQTAPKYHTASFLLDTHWPPGAAVRLLGVGIANLQRGRPDRHRQLSLFDLAGPSAGRAGKAAALPQSEARRRTADQAIDVIRSRYGEGAIARLSQLSSATHRRLTDRQNIGPAFAHRPEGHRPEGGEA